MSQTVLIRSIPFQPARSRAAASVGAAVLGAALVLAALGAAPAAAQDERLVGIWQKDYSRSDAPFPGRHDRPQPNAPDVEVEFSLEGDDVVVVQSTRRHDWPAPRHVTVKYITNGKPTPARDLRSGGMLEVRSKWRKKGLTVSFTAKLPGFEADVQEFWEISKNGKDLIHKIVGRTDAGRPDIREEYFVPASAVQ